MINQGEIRRIAGSLGVDPAGIDHDYGRESFEARVYYRGPWDYGGSSRSLRVHLNRDELMLFPSQSRAVRHSYSDRSDLPEASIRVYSLEEILAEKLRAFSGQRRYAIARDLYDIRFLSNASVRIADVLGAFSEKCAAKGMEAQKINLETIERRKSEYEANWKNNLEYLIPENLKVPFEGAWAGSISLLRWYVVSANIRLAFVGKSSIVQTASAQSGTSPKRITRTPAEAQRRAREVAATRPNVLSF